MFETFLLLLILVAQPLQADVAESPGGTFLGGYGGFPHFVSIGMETAISTGLDLGLHIGGIVLVNSFGARIVWTSSTEGPAFRAFGGLVAIHNSYADHEDDPTGLALHGWGGIGFGLGLGDWRLNLDAGLLLGGDPDSGMGINGLFPSGSIGVLHRI